MSRMSHRSGSAGRRSRGSVQYQALSCDSSSRRQSTSELDQHVQDGNEQVSEKASSQQWPLAHVSRAKPPRKNVGKPRGLAKAKAVPARSRLGTASSAVLASRPRGKTNAMARKAERRQSTDVGAQGDVDIRAMRAAAAAALQPDSRGKCRPVPEATSRSRSPRPMATVPETATSHVKKGTQRPSLELQTSVEELETDVSNNSQSDCIELSECCRQDKLSMATSTRPLSAASAAHNASPSKSKKRTRKQNRVAEPSVPARSQRRGEHDTHRPRRGSLPSKGARWNASPLFEESDSKSHWSSDRAIDDSSLHSAKLYSCCNSPTTQHRPSAPTGDFTAPGLDHIENLYADPQAVLKALPSRSIGPTRLSIRRLRASSRRGRSPYDKANLRVIAYENLRNPLRAHSTGMQSPCEEDYMAPSNRPLPMSARHLQHQQAECDGGIYESTLSTLVPGVGHRGIATKPSSCSIYMAAQDNGPSTVAASKSLFSVSHAGAAMPGNLGSRRKRLDDARQPPKKTELSLSERFSYQMFLTKRKSQERFENLWFCLGFWRSSLKLIEGRFGTGVVAYFRFLRSLLFMNFLLTVLTVSFIVVPQVISSDYTMFRQNDSTSTGWDGHLADVIIGRGFLRPSVVYSGTYSNSTTAAYSIPLAYLFTSLAVLVVSFVWVLLSVNKSYQRQYVQQLNSRYKYTNMVFSGWDYNIANGQTAKFKSISIRRDLEEEISDEVSVRQQMSWSELILISLRRLAVNVVVVGLLALAAWCIYLATNVSIQAHRSARQQANRDAAQTAVYYIKTLSSSLTIAAFNAVLPIVFENLTSLEKWRTPRLEVKYTLIRTVFVRLASLSVLVVSLFLRLKDCHVRESDECVCWELSVGQEFYQLAFLNFVFVMVFTLIEGFMESQLYFRCKWYRRTIGPPNFPLVKNVLDLLYIQLLAWLGYFFCPILPAMAFISLFCFFYIKKWHLLFFMIPSTKPYRGYRNSQLFNGLLLLIFCLALLPLGFVALKVQPSVKCGPFRGRRYVYSVFVSVLEDGPNWFETAVNIVVSHAFAIPAFILLLLLVAYFKNTSRAHSTEVAQLHDQVNILVTDKNFLVDKFQYMISHAATLFSSKVKKENCDEHGDGED